MPPVASIAKPPSASDIANVVIKAGMRRATTARPLIAPRIADPQIASAIAGQKPMKGRMPPARFISCCRSEPPAPMTIAARMAIATIDKSIPATSITSVWPRARTPITDPWYRMIERFDGWMKRPPEASVATTMKAMNTTTMAFRWTNCWRRSTTLVPTDLRAGPTALMCARGSCAGSPLAGAER